jgi:hypothetical protein
MELLREYNYEFYGFDDVVAAGQPEQEYYAQVADGEQFRVPRGEGERLLNAMGLKNPTQIRQYRKLLRLPGDVWRRADDEDWPESRLRKFYTVTTVTVSRGKKTERSVNPFVERVNRRRRSRVWNYANRLDTLNAAEKQRALEEIEADERWLTELKSAIRNRLGYIPTALPHSLRNPLQ